MENQPPANPKKGIGALGWIGIGCGGIIALVVIGIVIFTVMFGGKIKQFAADAEKDPAKALANVTVSASAGTMEMVASDEEQKRYTVRTKQDGKLLTFYWSEKKKTVETVQGDFSAIPPEKSEAEAPAEPGTVGGAVKENKQ